MTVNVAKNAERGPEILLPDFDFTETGQVLLLASLIQRAYFFTLQKYLKERLQLEIQRKDSHWISEVFPTRVARICTDFIGDDYLLHNANSDQLVDRLKIFSNNGRELVLSLQIIERDLWIEFSLERKSIFLFFREKNSHTLDVRLQEILGWVLANKM
ncbi:MAG: hypothetical protein AAB552_01585 [Patescibacteria group bacterium]